MKTMAFAHVQSCLLLVHGPESPADDEWMAWLGALHGYAERTARARLLIYTEGGAPTPKQRSAMDAIAKRHQEHAKVAVLTGSTFVRGVVNALGRFYPIYRAFDLNDLERALVHLDCAPAQLDEMKRRLEGLRTRLGLPPRY